MARIDGDDLAYFLEGCGWSPRFVEGSDPDAMHQRMASVMDVAIADIRQFQEDARSGKSTQRPRWPVIVLRSPKGWTGPKKVDGVAIEGTFRSHQVPLLVDANHAGHVAALASWMKSYRPDELFDGEGRLMPELAALAPAGDRRMGATPMPMGAYSCAICAFPTIAPLPSPSRRPVRLPCRTWVRWGRIFETS